MIQLYLQNPLLNVEKCIRLSMKIKNVKNLIHLIQFHVLHT